MLPVVVVDAMYPILVVVQPDLRHRVLLEHGDTAGTPILKLTDHLVLLIAFTVDGTTHQRVLRISVVSNSSFSGI